MLCLDNIPFIACGIGVYINGISNLLCMHIFVLINDHEHLYSCTKFLVYKKGRIKDNCNGLITMIYINVTIVKLLVPII